jgi:hypothetical protein
MIEIYSRVEPLRLLHIIYSLSSVTKRTDLLEIDNPLQVSVVRKNIGDDPLAHAHKSKTFVNEPQVIQESWFVYKGKVEVLHFDLDKSLIGTHILVEGDLNITLLGGHSFRTLSNDTIILEHKNGPYLGRHADKEFI